MKFKKNYGGGGGQTVSSIPEWAQPYLENVGKASEGAYADNELGKVAGATQNQQFAFDTGAKSIREVGRLTGEDQYNQSKRMVEAAQTGGYNTRALKDAAILEAEMNTAKLGNQYGAAGTLGSARQGVQQGAQNAATNAAFAKIDQDAAQTNYMNKMAAEKQLLDSGTARNTIVSNAVSGIGKLGNEQRGIEQQGLDATYQGLQRFASTIYGNPARQQSAGGK
jgi:hypothetical protein